MEQPIVDRDVPSESETFVAARKNLRLLESQLAKEGREYTAYIVSQARQILERAA